MRKNLLLLLMSLTFSVFAINQIVACEIGEVSADVQPCNESGNFFVMINFEYGEVGEQGFRIQGNGNNYGNYSYEDLPVQVGPLEGDGTTVYEFVVIDNQYEDCSNWTAVDPVDCEGSGGGEECNIWDVWADNHPCNDDGYFYVLLGFEYENVGENGFKVQGNGTNYGTFQYDDIPVEIGPLLGDGVTEYEFVVKDLQIEGCSDWTSIEPVDCEGGGGDCNIFGMEVATEPCNDDGYFWAVLDFEYDNVSESGFNVYVNDEYYGSYDYEALPVEIGPILGDGETIHNFFVVDYEFISCAGWLAIDPVDCNGGGNQCEIGELEINVQPCNDDGMFFVEIDFEYAHVSEAGFKLYVNDDLFESYSYDDLPIEAGPFEGDGVTIYNFFVRDIMLEGCNSTSAIDPVNCEGEASADIYENSLFFPNPVIMGEVLNLNSNLEKPRTVIIYNARGEEVFKKENSNSDSFIINEQRIETGIYFYEVRTSFNVYKGKLIVK